MKKTGIEKKKKESNWMLGLIQYYAINYYYAYLIKMDNAFYIDFLV